MKKRKKCKMDHFSLSLSLSLSVCVSLSIELIDYSFSIHLSVCFLATGAPMNLRDVLLFHIYIYIYIYVPKMARVCYVDIAIIKVWPVKEQL